MSEVTIWAAFGAGIASFISPCCLPLYPSYLSYITGVSVTDLKSEHPGKQVRMRTMSHTLFFILGFSVVYYTLGYSTNKFAEFFSEYQTLIRQLSAVLIILMGLILVGLIQPGMLMKERKLPIKLRNQAIWPPLYSESGSLPAGHHAQVRYWQASCCWPHRSPEHGLN